MAERIAKRHKVSTVNDVYKKTEHIVGSVAEIELLFRNTK